MLVVDVVFVGFLLLFLFFPILCIIFFLFFFLVLSCMCIRLKCSRRCAGLLFSRFSI